MRELLKTELVYNLGIELIELNFYVWFTRRIFTKNFPVYLRFYIDGCTYRRPIKLQVLLN